MKQKTWGIILLAAGLAATAGGAVNGTLAKLGDGVSVSEAVPIALMAACVVAGIVLLVKPEKKK